MSVNTYLRGFWSRAVAVIVREDNGILFPFPLASVIPITAVIVAPDRRHDPLE